MRDDRRIIVANEGMVTVFGVVFVVLMVIAVIDHVLTLAWMSIASWFG